MEKLKAVLMTAENVRGLSGRYGFDDWDTDELVGLYLVAPFGEDAQSFWSFVTKSTLDSMYTITDAKLENGFFEIERK